MTSCLKSKFVKSTLVLFFAAFILITAIGFALLYNNSQSMTRAFIRQDIALVGGMSKKEAINKLCILTGTVNKQDIDAGNKLLSPYSYDEKLPIGASSYYQHIFNLHLILYFACAFVLFVLTLSVILTFIFRMNKKYRVFTTEISSLDFSSDSLNQEDGDFAALRSAVVALAKRSGFHADALQKDKEYLKNLLSDISHQLKTPLAALRMYNEILIDKPELATEKRMEFLTRSKNQIDRTDWLIQGLLKMARVEAGAVQMNKRYCYIIDTIEQAVSTFEETARQKGVRLILDIPPEIRLCHDSDWVAEAISNIIKNAIEHTPAGGEINVTAKETPLTVVVNIKDTGEGMASSEIPHIFERFYRKDTGTGTGNVGIGLSLAKEILEKNSGEIFLKSAPGCGSEFILTFLKNS